MREASVITFKKLVTSFLFSFKESYTHTHTHTHMYIYIGIYVYIKNLLASAGDIRDAGSISGS